LGDPIAGGKLVGGAPARFGVEVEVVADLAGTCAAAPLRGDERGLGSVLRFGAALAVVGVPEASAPPAAPSEVLVLERADG
jgi:hypothetical protein